MGREKENKIIHGGAENIYIDSSKTQLILIIKIINCTMHKFIGSLLNQSHFIIIAYKPHWLHPSMYTKAFQISHLIP